jgi:hypothetical protein
VLTCAALALAPDLDILFSSHRTGMHSVGALGLVLAAAAMAARWRGWPVLATTMACGIAFGSHLFLDWLGHDAAPPIGLLVLWPFSETYYISGADVFADVSRRYWKPEEFILKNAQAVARELLILGPIALLAWWARRRSVLSRLDNPGADPLHCDFAPLRASSRSRRSASRRGGRPRAPSEPRD